MGELRVLPLPHLIIIILLLSGAHLGQPQVPPESPLEPKPPAQVGDGQLTWRRSRRHSPHFPLCSFCCNCCRNRGCGFCCRT